MAQVFSSLWCRLVDTLLSSQICCYDHHHSHQMRTVDKTGYPRCSNIWQVLLYTWTWSVAWDNQLDPCWTLWAPRDLMLPQQWQNLPDFPLEVWMQLGWSPPGWLECLTVEWIFLNPHHHLPPQQSQSHPQPVTWQQLCQSKVIWTQPDRQLICLWEYHSELCLPCHWQHQQQQNHHQQQQVSQQRPAEEPLQQQEQEQEDVYYTMEGVSSLTYRY